MQDDDGRSLEDLMAATARGERAAFGSLYERTSAKLFGIVLRIVRNRQQAEDVLQDVYLKVWQRAHTYDRRQGRPVTWMAAVARNRAIDVVRATRPTRPLDEGEGGEEAFQAGAHVARVDALDPAEMETLRRCLDDLDEQDRNLILLAYYEGFSREELAERFAMPVGTVKTRLRRGLQRLRGCLDG